MYEIRHIFSALRRKWPWVSLLLSLMLAATAYQRPFSYSLSLGAAASASYITNFYPPQNIAGRDARWSAAYSYITLPGTGGNRPLRVTVQYNPLRDGIENPPPIHIQGIVGGVELFSRTLQPGSGWQSMVMDVDSRQPQALAARDLVIELRTDVYRPPAYPGTEFGLLVSRVTVEPLPGASGGPVVPNVSVMLMLAVLALTVYLLVSRILLFALPRPAGVTGDSGGDRSKLFLLAALISLGVGLLVSLNLLSDLVTSSATLQSLLALVVAAYIVLVVGGWLAPHAVPALLMELHTIRLSLNYTPLLVLLVAALVIFGAIFQLPVSYSVDVGSGRDTPFIEGFNAPLFPLPGGSPGNYRTTSAHAYVIVPGVGSDNSFKVTLRMAADGGPALKGDTRINANGREVGRVRLGNGWQDVVVTATSGPSGVFNAANLDLEIVSPTELAEGGEQRGALVDRVTIEQVGSIGVLSRSPAHESGLLLGLLLLYLLVARSGGVVARLPSRRLALCVTTLTAAIVAWALAVYRVDVLVALPHTLMTLALGYLLFVAAVHLLPRISGRATPATLRPVATTLALAFMLRYGFSALPQAQVIDLPYHLKWLKTLLGGDFLALYLPSAGGLSSVPPEWNLNVLIPKSPLFYVALWPLGFFRAIALGPAILLVTSLFDTSVVLLLFVLLRRVSFKAALWSALLYAVMPLAMRAFAFGILPTILAQALALLVIAIPVLFPDGLRRPLPFAGWVLLLAASLVAFPTALAFNSFVLIFSGVGWAWQRAAPRSTLTLLAGGFAIAVVLSFVAYYGLYIGPFLAQTLPAMQGGVRSHGQELWPGGLPELIGWTAGYSISWVLWLLLPTGIWLLWQSGTSPQRAGQSLRQRLASRMAILMLAWLIIFVLGVALNLRFDMIGKHIYYTMPATAIAGGLVLSHLWAHNYASRQSRLLAVLVALSVVWSAVSFFAGRL